MRTKSVGAAGGQGWGGPEQRFPVCKRHFRSSWRHPLKYRLQALSPSQQPQVQTPRPRVVNFSGLQVPPL